MSAALAKRLKVLEQKHRPRLRIIVWDRSEPRPLVDAAPGEEVVYVTWSSGGQAA